MSISRDRCSFLTSCFIQQGQHYLSHSPRLAAKFRFLSHQRAVSAHASLCICIDWPEPSLRLAYTNMGVDEVSGQNLALLDGSVWVSIRGILALIIVPKSHAGWVRPHVCLLEALGRSKFRGTEITCSGSVY